MKQSWRLTKRFNAVFVKKGRAKPCWVRIPNANSHLILRMPIHYSRYDVKNQEKFSIFIVENETENKTITKVYNKVYNPEINIDMPDSF